MSVNTSTATELTEEQVQTILVQPLEAASVFLGAGPRVFDTNGSQVRVRKMGGPIDGPGWTGESELIPTKDVDFGEVNGRVPAQCSVRPPMRPKSRS